MYVNVNGLVQARLPGNVIILSEILAVQITSLRRIICCSPVAIRHNSEIDWLKWGRRLIACVLFVVLSAALYGVNQKFRESRKGLEHCSMTVQQASRQAQVCDLD
jgi:hypothetical protein